MQWFQKGRFVYFIFQVCAVFSAEGYSVNKVMGERFAGPITMVVTIIGQQQCVKECMARPKLCKGVNYLKKHLLCEMVSSIEESEPSSDYTRISVDHISMDEVNNCHVCTTNQKCVQLRSNSSHCVKDDTDMNDCGAYHSLLPFLPSGLYRIKLPVVGHVTALCEMDIDGGGWTVFQRRLNGTEDFYRTWVEYKNGFGNLTAEFWFGNEKLYHLLSQGTYELRMDMSDFTDQTRYVKYTHVGLTDEITKYTISLSNYSGNVEDCFTRASGINNIKFTTRDQDNDPYLTANCANLYPSGWWHNQCHCANPNGLYLDGQTNQFGKGITYSPWLTQYYSLKTISLMVRRV